MRAHFEFLFTDTFKSYRHLRADTMINDQTKRIGTTADHVTLTNFHYYIPRHFFLLKYRSIIRERRDGRKWEKRSLELKWFINGLRQGPLVPASCILLLRYMLVLEFFSGGSEMGFWFCIWVANDVCILG